MELMKQMSKEKGQIALTIALIIAVVSAVSLSVFARSLPEIRLSGVDESAAKAIQSAEAGVEQALSGLGLGTFTGSFEGADYTVTVSKSGSSGFLSAASVSNGEVAEVDLSGSSGMTSLTVYWGDESISSETDTAAVEIIKYQRFGAADYRMAKYAYDPNAARRGDNKFVAPTVDPGSFLGGSFGASVDIPIVAEDVLVRIKPFYNRARLGFSPQPAGALLGDQFYTISAQGVADGSVFRQVEVASSSAGLPEVFDMTLYSGAGLTQ